VVSVDGLVVFTALRKVSFCSGSGLLSGCLVSVSGLLSFRNGLTVK
jgi:hypothetical protein